ncbi:MAG: hypothetical protein H0T89_08405 [Deltaproteobacteria bacterium]|nr:hypothetical protein [Deltaproteobacteria bacterium]MDQ3299200.1 energy transducer TonB [Myxococcota bacterium]
MNRVAALLASLVLAVPALVAAKPMYRPPPRPDSDVGGQLGEAIRKRDLRRITDLLRDPVTTTTAMWFPDAACTRRFAKPATIRGRELTALARCLLGLEVVSSTRVSGTAGGAIITYEPGIEVYLNAAAGRIRYIGFEHARPDDRGMPTLTVQAFEQLRKTGSTSLDTVLDAALDPDTARRARESSPASAWIKLCLDKTGAITSKRVVQATPVALGRAFETAIADWTFKPFVHRKVPMAACSLSLLTYPAAKAPPVEHLPSEALPTADDLVGFEDDDEGEDGVAGGVVGGIYGGSITRPPPPPPPPSLIPMNVPPTMLEANRIRGIRVIVPDARTITAIESSGRTTAVAAIKMCLDDTGMISSLKLLKSSGFPDYDRKLETGMRTWAFRPYVINGRNVPVCTAVTFVYKSSTVP